MPNRFGFLYGKTFMSNGDLNRWLAVSKFSDGIQAMIDDNATINDISVLELCERILAEDLNSDTICGVNRDKLAESAAKLRNDIEDFKFKPNWIREKYPTVWTSFKRMVTDSGMVVVPMQVGRYIQVLKYVSNLEDNGICEVFVGGVDPFYVGHVTISFEKLSMSGTHKMNELFGRLRFCDSIEIDTDKNLIEVSLTVNGLAMKSSDFRSSSQAKKSWILKWNQDLKSNLKREDV